MVKKLNEKERGIFYAGLGLGILGGAIASIWSGYMFRLLDALIPNPDIKTSIISAIVSTIAFFVLIVWIIKQV